MPGRGWLHQAGEEEGRPAVSSQVGSVLPVTASPRPEHLAWGWGWGRGAEGAVVVSTRALPARPGEGAQNPSPGQGRGWERTASGRDGGGGDCATHPCHAGCPPAWTQEGWPPLGGPYSAGWWGVGRRLAWGPGLPRACLTAGGSCLSDHPHPGIPWGCAAHSLAWSRRGALSTVMSCDSVRPRCCWCGSHPVLSGPSSWAPKGKRCHLFSYLSKKGAHFHPHFGLERETGFG